MFFESGGQSLVELNRLGQGIEERLGILAVQAHDFVRVNGLFSMRQSTGQDKTTDRFRSDEHTSELPSLMRLSYAVFCLKTETDNKAALTSFHESTTFEHKPKH